MIDQLLKEKNCILVEKVKDWKEAVHVSLEPLVQDGYCTREYEQAVLRNTDKYGAYYVLTDDMALIHASSQDGVIQTQMAITLLKEPVQFSEDGPGVRILIALAAKDKESHMDGIVAITNIFGEDGHADPVLNAKSSKEIYDIFIRAGIEE